MSYDSNKVPTPIFVKVDWSKNGSFTDTYDDVTDLVRGGISCSFGRDSVTSLSPIVGGRGGFALDNRTRRFSPRYSASPLFGNLKPARPVQITRLVSGTTYTIFRGHTDDNPVTVDIDQRTVSFNLVDSLQDFQNNRISTRLYQGIRSGTAIGYILDAAGWTGGRDIDTGSSVFPWWWEENTDAFSALQRVLASEGPPALLYMGVNGEVIFRDRNHRNVRSASLTSQARITGTGATEPVMGRGFVYSDNWANIVNDVTFTVDERRPDAQTDVLFQTDEVITIGASSSQTVLIQTSDPFINAITPANKLDYTVQAGSVTGVSVSRTSGAACTVTLTAGVSGATVTNFQLRGQSVPVSRSYQVTATDSTSISDYGQRAYPSGMEPVWASRFDAQDIAQQYIDQRKQPLPALQIQFTCTHMQANRLAKVLSLDLSDRVTVVEPETGLNNDFFIEYIQHDISSVAEHVITLGLEMAPSVPTNVFILDSSTLNGTKILSY